jgi:hypothetical protein
VLEADEVADVEEVVVGVAMASVHSCPTDPPQVGG